MSDNWRLAGAVHKVEFERLRFYLSFLSSPRYWLPLRSLCLSVMTQT